MKTRRLYGVLMFFVFVSSLVFAAGMLCPVLAYAVETGVPHAYGGPGKCETPLYAGQTIDAGTVSVWNSRENLKIQIEPSGEWLISEVHVFVGTGEVPTKKGNPIPGKFPYKTECSDPVKKHTTVVHLSDDMAFNWGAPWEAERIQNIAVHVDLVMLDEKGKIIAEEGAWACGPNEFEGSQWGWWFDYEMAHPRRGHFIDSPVSGLSYQTPTFGGLTNESGGFDYFPGERVVLEIGSVRLGNPIAGHRISPLDIFEAADTDDPRVINMARLLQSLDADTSPKDGINITEDVVACLEQTVQGLGLASLDFSDDGQIEKVIQGTIGLCTGLVAVSAEVAKANLDRSTDTDMFRKNVSRTPDMASAKAKLNIMGVWLPALRANGDLAYYIDDSGDTVYAIPYYDADGNFIRDADKAKPIVVIYCDEVETGAHDVFASISRDDGHTWKRKNISRMADRSSFTLANGLPYYGHCKKPVFQVKGNKILVAWTTKFAKGGKPRYSITTCDDPATEVVETPEDDNCQIVCRPASNQGDEEVCEPDYPHDDDYCVDDIWGVSGPQRSVDYTDQSYPEVGEVPYSAVWVARAVIATQADVDNGLGTFVGDIVWFKPERLTSGRRDANQNFCAGADGAGFAVTWQEDPYGLRPGEAKGPGSGWGGATTNHKTDIWYSYITWGDFAMVDVNFEPGGDPEHDDIDFIGRPKALVPMSLPVRVSDNNAVNIGNMELRLYSNGYPVVHSDGYLMHLNDGRATVGVSYESNNLTRCVKFEGGETIVETGSTETAMYKVLPELPADHNSNKHCTNCHVPYEEENVGITPPLDPPQQAAPIPLVVVDETIPEYLGGFTNSDCVSCHYDHIVPRDRVIAVTSGISISEADKCTECESNGGIWKDGTQGGDNEIIEAYYPYEGYPYIAGGDDYQGSYRYGYMLPRMCNTYKDSVLAAGGSHLEEPENWEDVDLSNWYDFVNQQGVDKRCLATDNQILLDGNTGASRSNLFLQPYTKPDGTKSAWAIMAYEETKGVGLGPPEESGEIGDPLEDGSGYDPYETFPDEGKNVIYHSFDFQNPDEVSAGTILNQPETDKDGNPLYVVEVPCLGSLKDDDGNFIFDAAGNYICDENPDAGEPILDWKRESILAYENARRPRFILQSKAAAGPSGTVLIVLYKEGEDGAGRPSDIMSRRCVAGSTGNPYAPGNFVLGAQNVSTVTPLAEWINPDRDLDAKGDGIKVCKWNQPKENLKLKSGVNPYEDARAHRGGIRGDFVIMGYSFTPNWAASRNAHDKYDFYIRRSFDGGASWTTDPDTDSTETVVHTDIFIDPEGVSGDELPTIDEEGNDITEATKHYEVTTAYAGGGVYEPGRNVSLIKNNKTSVIEPRIVAVPGTIKGTGETEDQQNRNVFYVAYGTATNLPDVGKAPEDLFFSFSTDKGTTLFEEEWVVNPDSEGNYPGETVTGLYRLAKGDQEQGEVQIRMTPDGSRFYSVWLDEGDEGSDIMFRRIMSGKFECNNVHETP